MIIDDFNIIRISTLPNKTDAPLIVDTYAPLAFSIPGKPFQTVGGRNAEEINRFGGMDLSQFSQSNLLDIMGEPSGKAPRKNSFSFLASECFNHDFY